MRYFLSRRTPPLTRVLLIESGSREVLNRLIPVLRQLPVHSDDGADGAAEAVIDLVTCYAGEPPGVNGRVYRVQDHAGSERRGALYRELAARRHTAIGIVCSAEPIMTKWKWVLAARVPAKLFIINENADFFWVDRGHRRHITRFALYRTGMTGASVVPALARLVFFPLTLLYLLLYAGSVHLMRAMRLLRGDA